MPGEADAREEKPQKAIAATLQVILYADWTSAVAEDILPHQPEVEPVPGGPNAYSSAVLRELAVLALLTATRAEPTIDEQACPYEFVTRVFVETVQRLDAGLQEGDQEVYFEDEDDD